MAGRIAKGPKVGTSGEVVVRRLSGVSSDQSLCSACWSWCEGTICNRSTCSMTHEAELEVIVDTSNVHAIPGLDAFNDLEGLLDRQGPDAVISVDNANAHFAGALGIETTASA